MEDKKLAEQFVDADLERMAQAAKARGLPASLLTYDDLEQTASPEVPEGTMVSFVIGIRGDLTKRAADQAGRLWQTMREQNPDRIFFVSILGYDDDPRELWHLPDVCRYVRRWARAAGIDDPERAAFDSIPATERELTDPETAEWANHWRGYFVGFLGACGVFGEDMRAALTGAPLRPN